MWLTTTVIKYVRDSILQIKNLIIIKMGHAAA
jgi:hypothetical protein